MAKSQPNTRRTGRILGSYLVTADSFALPFGFHMDIANAWHCARFWPAVGADARAKVNAISVKLQHPYKPGAAFRTRSRYYKRAHTHRARSVQPVIVYVRISV